MAATGESTCNWWSMFVVKVKKNGFFFCILDYNNRFFVQELFDGRPAEFHVEAGNR